MNHLFMKFLKKNEGKTFYTVTGLPLTYELRANGMYISRVRDSGEYTFSYENIQRALELMPVHSVSDLEKKGIRGHSYCFAIITEFLKTVQK